MNGSCDRYGELRITLEIHTNEITNAWKTVGITAQLYDGIRNVDNRYYLNGKQITQEEARQHAMNYRALHDRIRLEMVKNSSRQLKKPFGTCRRVF